MKLKNVLYSLLGLGCLAEGAYAITFTATGYAALLTPNNQAYKKNTAILFTSTHDVSVYPNSTPTSTVSGSWAFKNGYDAGVVAADSGAFIWAAGDSSTQSYGPHEITGSATISTPGTYTAFAKTTWDDVLVTPPAGYVSYDQRYFSVIS